MHVVLGFIGGNKVTTPAMVEGANGRKPMSVSDFVARHGEYQRG